MPKANPSRLAPCRCEAKSRMKLPRTFSVSRSELLTELMFSLRLVAHPAGEECQNVTDLAVPRRGTTLYVCNAPLILFGPPIDVFFVVTIPTALMFTLVLCCRLTPGSRMEKTTAFRSG